MRAVVLSAGFGTRLGDLTRDVPKAVLPIGGRSLVEHVVANLARHGWDEIAVNLHYRPELVRERLGDGERLGARITYSFEPELLGTAGTLVSLRDFLAQGPFLVHYGDVLTDEDFTRMLAAHRRCAATMTLLVHERPGANSVVVLDERQRLLEFVERPAADDPVRSRSSWANSGICICEPAILDLLPPPPSDLAGDVLPHIAGRTDVYGFPLTGRRIAVDSPERYRQAEQLMAEIAEESR